MTNNQESIKNIVLFDGNCNFCDATIQKIIKYDKKDTFRFASQQSEVGQRLMRENNCFVQSMDTVILIKGKSVYIKTDAVIEICKLLFGFSIIALMLRCIPRYIRDYFYAIFAKNRYQWFGKKTICSIPTQEVSAKFLD